MKLIFYLLKTKSFLKISTSNDSFTWQFELVKLLLSLKMSFLAFSHTWFTHSSWNIYFVEIWNVSSLHLVPLFHVIFFCIFFLLYREWHQVMLKRWMRSKSLLLPHVQLVSIVISLLWKSIYIPTMYLNSSITGMLCKRGVGIGGLFLVWYTLVNWNPWSVKLFSLFSLLNFLTN